MHRVQRYLFYLALALTVGSMPVLEASGQILFNEVAESAGIGTEIYDSASAHGLGVIWIDYDNDGFPDLFAVNGGGLPAHLFHNEGDGTFSNQDALLPAMPLVEQTGAMFADYDNDGDQDIYITVAGALPDQPDGGVNMLLQNQWVENGNQLSTPLFIDVAAAAGVDNKPASPFGALEGYASYTGAWLDFDRDGCVDLFVGNMDWDEAGTSSNANQLYKNNCDGTFNDVTISSGVDTGDNNDLRPTLAFFGGLLTPGDIDPDLYVVNVHDASPFHHDLIYENNGDGTFTEYSTTMPTFGDDSGAGMGTAVADIDHDGDWDIYVTDLPDPGGVEPIAEGNVLYLGNPDGTWSENAGPAAGVESNASWGANFADFDQDGYEDLWVGTIAPNNAISSIYHNNGDGTFDDITGEAGFLTEFPARGTAAADYDRDGDIDIIQINLFDRINLYENISSGQGNYLQIDLIATVSNRSAIGTLVEATVGGTTYMRQVNGGASAHSQDDLLVHFGLGSATTVDELKISWPSGTVQTLTDVGVNQLLSVTEEGGTGGTATLSSDVSSLDFGAVEEGASSAPMAVTLTNDGTDALDVTTVSITGTDAGDFSHDLGTPVTLSGGASTTLNVTFTPTASAAPLASSVIYRVNAGGGVVSDWEEDSAVSPSSYVDAAATTAHTTDAEITLDSTVPAGTPMELFQSARTDGAKAAPDMEWDFPVTVGDELTIRLYFSEIVRCQSGSHIFDVVIEGETVLEEYNLFDDVGCEVGTMKEFTVTAGDDNLDIDFPLGGNNRPSIVSAIEVESASGTGGPDNRTADLVVNHTGTNGAVTVALSGEATTSGGGNNPPTASFSFAATDLSVDFTDASSDSDGSIASWSWDFGDGNSSTEQNPTHVYAGAGTYTVELTVTDDLGDSGSSSQDVTVSDGNVAPTASFSFAATDLSVDFTDASTDSDGSIASWSWDFGDGNSSTDQNPTHAFAAYGTYTVTLTVTDDLGAAGEASQDVTLSDPNADGAFIEADGMAVMEAENFHTRIDRSDHSWVENSDNAGFSGATAMVTDPDDATFISSDITTTSPELVFDIDITTTGDYHLWVRMWAPSSSSNSVHIGMNGEIDAMSKGAQTQTIGSWVWLKLQRGATPLTYNVASAGVHTFNLWMREDGAWIDKIVITTDGAFVPTDEGPAESPQATAAKSGVGGLDVLSFGETIQDIPDEFALESNYPNPFNPSTTIQFALPQEASVTLEVFDAMGRRVATLVNNQLAAGRYEAIWNGRNDAGATVASGMYLYRLRAGQFVQSRTMLFMK